MIPDDYLDDIAHVLDAEAEDIEQDSDPFLISGRLRKLAAKIRKQEPVR